MKYVRASHHRNIMIFNIYLNFRTRVDASRMILTRWTTENSHKNVKKSRFAGTTTAIWFRLRKVGVVFTLWVLKDRMILYVFPDLHIVRTIAYRKYRN